MNDFNPLEVVENSELILVDGLWPYFHDAEIHHFSYWKGDIRSEEDIWEGPDIVLDLELCALANPFFVKLRFSRCDTVKMSADNPDNIMLDLDMEYEERGFFSNGEPLPPYIVVKLKESFGFHLDFIWSLSALVSRF
jgi:hypothetical protein